jgi:MerR family transcriptional regulator, copper efflux regulator
MPRFVHECVKNGHMRISEAAGRLGTTPRMLRYREALGLLPPGADTPGMHRQYDRDDLAAAAWAAVVEQRYTVSPAALAFALRALADPAVAADVAQLGRLTGRVSPPTRALDFDQLKAQRLLEGYQRPTSPGTRSQHRHGRAGRA